ncbi:glutamate racemase [Parvibaculum sp. MBR-TMA-1.3b-4.2]|jgi:glutamate racemase
MAERAGPILVFDSGIGGLSVLDAIHTLLPTRQCIYVADDVAFPYGEWEEAALIEHIVQVMDGLVEAHAPRAIVIACNTASTLVLPALRARFTMPIVGTVPAIKPAAGRTKSGVISVLATPGTIARDYTRQLIQQFAADVHVELVASRRLAAIAEKLLQEDEIDTEAVREEILPCFIETASGRTDIVVLGCTHYPFLIPHMSAVAPWPVDWLDPAPAIAQRLAALIEDDTRIAEGEGFTLFTSGASAPRLLAGMLRARGVPVAGHQ